MLRIEPGGEYRGEVYISCDSHPTTGYNNGQGRGAIFDGTSMMELAAFLVEHVGCPSINDGEFCCATPGMPKGVNWPVCSRRPHDDNRHESADYYWIDRGPAAIKSDRRECLFEKRPAIRRGENAVTWANP
jgi:hypothetical protein